MALGGHIQKYKNWGQEKTSIPIQGNFSAHLSREMGSPSSPSVWLSCVSPVPVPGAAHSSSSSSKQRVVQESLHLEPSSAPWELSVSAEVIKHLGLLIWET